MPANGQRYTDRNGDPIVVVTGMGVVTSLGAGRQDNWKALTGGTSGIHSITRFPTESLRTTIAGTVDFVPAEPLISPELSERLAEMAIEEAVTQAAIGSRGDFPGPLFMAIPPIEIEWPQRRALADAVPAGEPVDYPHLLKVARDRARDEHVRCLFGSIADHMAERFGTKGMPVSLSTACASGGTAIQLGLETIRRGDAEAVLTVGADGSIQPETVVRFSLLSALSTQNDPPEGAAKPFSKNRDGFVMAEGGAALVLESLEHATARGARILGVVEGCGERADSFHRTRSSPDGHAIVGAIEAALKDAGVAPHEVDYVNAHGTGTPENDKMEYLGLTSVFGDHAERMPVSSNKSMIGHTLTAAGAVEAVFSLMTMQEGRIPPTINYDVPDPAIPLDVVPNVARDAAVKRVMSNSFGFGGQNVCLIFGAEPA